MSHSSTKAESFSHADASVGRNAQPLAHAAAEAYNPNDSSYSSVFPSRASSGNSDAVLHSVLSVFSSPYDADHAAGIKDLLHSPDSAVKGDQQSAPGKVSPANDAPVINPPDRNDNGMVRGETPQNPQGKTAWDPYEALTLPLHEWQPGESKK